MVWIIIAAVIIVGSGILWTTRRMKVLKSKEELQQSIESVIASFSQLRDKVHSSNLPNHEKTSLVKNIEQNIEQLERWKNTALPNITFMKNHTEPIEKEFNGLKESVARELSKYDELAGSVEID